ncbi:probable sugar phosphate/phosphate translocator at3g17430 [Phtheirospermum japonicum]|uniref:Probable sugar phosphate/phosphate translocator at3g17430 n=1 Tax=Phtheirospermum japonicum TaxID=374723 RepID=A0A830B7J8_9LAMI|nr:probable sugar phosphate/phosphate translocator at3g17430 [Phtheirospermum japonicum]
MRFGDTFERWDGFIQILQIHTSKWRAPDTCYRGALWVLSPKYFNFPFPITLTMIHMGFSGAVAFFLIRVIKVVSPVKMTLGIYATCVVPISAFFASSLWFGNTAYLHISVAFIQMLKALMPVATFVVAVLCGTDKLRWDVFLNMLLVSIGVVVSSYGEIHFNVIGTVYQVTGIFAEALRLVLTQVLLQKKGLTLNPITSLYYIAPCSFVFLFIPWYFLEKPGMEVSQIQFNFWIFFSNAVCALLLNFSIFLVIGRTGAVTVRVAALCGVVLYNYLKVKEVRGSQNSDGIPERVSKEWKLEKKSSDVFRPDSNNGDEIGSSTIGDFGVDEEAAVPLIPSSSSRLSHIGRTLQNARNS